MQPCRIAWRCERHDDFEVRMRLISQNHDRLGHCGRESLPIPEYHAVSMTYYISKLAKLLMKLGFLYRYFG